MITAKTPGAYRLNKGGKSRGYHERFTWEQVDQLRAEGKSWVEIAAIINVPKPALYNQWCKRNRKAKERQETKNAPTGAEVRE